MWPKSTKSSHPNGDGQPHHYFVPTVHFDSCSNAKIYVNTIINPPYPHCSSPPSKNTSKKNMDHDISKPSSGDIQRRFIDPDEGGRVDIYYGKEEDNVNSLPMVSVEMQKLSPAEIGKGSSKGTKIKPLKAYVITVHTNNISGEGAPTALVSDETVLYHTIEADNVVLNSAGDITVGPGARASNSGHCSGSVIFHQK